MTTKFCINCAHFTPDTSNWTVEKYQKEWGYCNREIKINPVTGETITDIGLAKSERLFTGIAAMVTDACGKRGKHYKEKAIENSFN